MNQVKQNLSWEPNTKHCILNLNKTQMAKFLYKK